MLLHQQRERLIAHASRGAWTIGNVDGIDAHRFQEAGTLQFLSDIGAFGRNNLDHRNEFAGRDLGAQSGALCQRICGHRDRHRMRSNDLGPCGLAASLAYAEG